MRDRWNSKTVFLFAAIGSAVGLGNVWRFPYLAYKFGGGAFLIPYALSLFVIGIPLLILELMLGQKYQAGAIESFRKIHRRLEGIGFAGILLSFLVVSYYAVVMAWMWIYLLGSLQTVLPWSTDSKGYFFQDVLQLSSGIDQVGGINFLVLAALAVTWVSIYFTVFQGVKSAEKVVKVTAPLPVVILLFLFVRGITLDGAFAGILAFIRPNFELLKSGEIWLAAASQIFFSLSLATGIMIAYASYNDPREDVCKNAWIISLANSSISIFSGFVVFSVLGFMASQSGVSVEEVAVSGPGLAFVVFPQALSQMPFPVLFSVLFFVMLLTLGIDSAFSLVEAINTALRDRFEKVSKELIAFAVCFWAFLCGLIYTTRAGLYFLDVIDHFVVQFGIVFVGLLQCIAVGWYYGAHRIRREFNAMGTKHLGKWWSFSIKYLIPLVLGILLVKQFTIESQKNYEGYPNWAIALAATVASIPFLFVLRYLLFPKRRDVIATVLEGGDLQGPSQS